MMVIASPAAGLDHLPGVAAVTKIDVLLEGEILHMDARAAGAGKEPGKDAESCHARK
jgi:hypothetical protein